MGLSIHYRLSLSPDKGAATAGTDDLRARWAVEEARKLALKMKRRGAFDKVFPLEWDADARRRTRRWPMLPLPGEPDRIVDVEIWAVEGHVFCIDVGRDCEPLWIGLCRYPKTARAYGYEFRIPRKERIPEWRLRNFSKTQYASLHGWEHFRRCHVAIVDFLAALRPLGFAVKISDEGGYWPRRSERALREEVGMMNRIGAAFAGALKDA